MITIHRLNFHNFVLYTLSFISIKKINKKRRLERCPILIRAKARTLFLKKRSLIELQYRRMEKKKLWTAANHY